MENIEIWLAEEIKASKEEVSKHRARIRILELIHKKFYHKKTKK